MSFKSEQLRLDGVRPPRGERRRVIDYHVGRLEKAASATEICDVLLLDAISDLRGTHRINEYINKMEAAYDHQMAVSNIGCKLGFNKGTLLAECGVEDYEAAHENVGEITAPWKKVIESRKHWYLPHLGKK